MDAKSGNVRRREMDRLAAKVARALFYASLLIIVALSLAPGESRPHTGFPGRVEHFVAYAGAGALLAFGYLALRARFAGLLALFVTSGALEFLQYFSPGRHPSIYDALASSAGGAFGLALGASHYARYAQLAR